jgi:hypothetical protein
MSAVTTVFLIVATSFVVIAASAATYNVTLKLNPTSSSYSPGQTPSETLTVANNGKATFIGKTCNLAYTGPFPGTKHAVCPTNFQSFSVAPGKSYTHHYASFPFRIPANAPKGTYHFTVTVGGTVNGVPFNSMPGHFDITVV